MNISKQINQLAKENTLHTEDEFLVSLYFPTNQKNTSQIANDLSLYLKDQLRNNHPTKNLATAQNEIIGNVEKKLSQLDPSSLSLSIFFKVNPNQHQHSRNLEIINQSFTLINLNTDLDKHFFLGKTYDLIPLFSSKDNTKKNYILILNQEAFTSLTYDGLEIVPDEEIENPFLISPQPKFMSKMTINQNKGQITTSAADKRQEEEVQIQKRFLDKITNHLKDKKLNDFNSIIVYYSSFFQNDIDNFINNLSKSFHQTIFTKIDKNIRTEDLDKKTLNQTLKKIEAKNMTDLYQSSIKDHYQLLSNLNQICEAANQGKIDLLFLPNVNMKKVGYVSEKLVSTFSIKNSKKIYNIFPWLAKKIYQDGGQIAVLNHNNGKFLSPKLLAHLRY